MKTLLLITALLVAMPLMARNDSPPTQDQQLLQGFQDKQKDIQETYDRVTDYHQGNMDAISTNQLYELNTGWTKALGEYDKLFPEVTTDTVLAKVNSIGATKDLREEYDRRKEQADEILTGVNTQIQTMKDSPFFKLLDDATKSNLEAKFGEITTQAQSQADLWKPLGLFDGKKAIEKKLLDAEIATKQITPLVQEALGTWQLAYSSVEGKALAEYDKLKARKDTSDNYYRGNIEKMAFQAALSSATTAGGYNQLKSDLILKDIKKMADEMGISLTQARDWLLNNDDLDKKIANTPMGLYVNKQISRAMAGICNEVAQCKPGQADSAADAFSDMFKFLNNSNRDGNPVEIDDGKFQHKENDPYSVRGF